MWRDHELSSSYDVVVIIGGGVHGLATAYYLAADHGITNVAVLDKSYIGGGGSGRNTAILRSNYLTPEGVRFYDRSVKLYETLGRRAELQRDVLPARPPHAGAQRQLAAHHALARRGQQAPGRRLRGDRPGRDQEAGARTSTSPTETRYPILGALYHPPGGIIRHDAVGVGLRPRPPTRPACTSTRTPRSPGSTSTGGRVTGVRTTAGHLATRSWSTAPPAGPRLISDMAGVRMPITTSPLQAAVTEPVNRSWTPSWSPARCTSTSARPTGASWCSAPASTRSRRTRCAARWSSPRAWPATCSS